MKQIFPILCFATVVALPINVHALGVCPSYDVCSRGCGGAGAACCPTEKTTYSCPSGWHASGTICKRNNSDAGSDSKGYRATTYGTCDATKNTQTCYMCSMTGCL